MGIGRILTNNDILAGSGISVTRTRNQVTITALDYVNNLVATGKAGGQNVYGGISASENLLLGSTTDATKGKVGTLDNAFYINADYASGDEDATLYFNAANASIAFEYAQADTGLNQFTLSHRIRINELYTATGDFGSDNMGWASRIAATYTYGTWALTGKAAIGLLVELANNINDADVADIEVATYYGYHYMLTANSKAPAYGYGIDMIKASPCTTANYMFGMSALLCSDVDPGTTPQYGAGFRATCQSLTGYTSAVRQHTAFLAEGNKGWKYGFLHIDTDAVAILFYTDLYGGIYSANTLSLANASQPPNAHTDNRIILYSADSSDNTSTLAMYLEQAVEEIGTFTASHKIKVSINGTFYWIQLDAV